jgi:hypothetical protein
LGGYLYLDCKPKEKPDPLKIAQGKCKIEGHIRKLLSKSLMPCIIKTILIRFLTCALLSLTLNAPAQNVRQITTNLVDETWGTRNSVISGGKLLWIDESNSVIFFNGVTTNLVQPRGTNGFVENPVFALGSGAAPGATIGVWRRGADGTSFVNTNGGPPMSIVATNPYDPINPLNAEAVAIADGSVFMIFSTGTMAPVFRVDPASGYATNLTGSALVPGAIVRRVSTSGGQAAWPFADNTSGILKLHFYDGSTLHVVDTNITGNPHIAHGRIVYTKPAGGRDQVFLYDSTVPSPAPVQITTDTTGTNRYPRTDGSHIAWLHTSTGATNADIQLYGGIPLTSASTQVPYQLASAERSFQLDRGQLLWQDVSNRLQYCPGSAPFPLDISPSISFGGSDGFAPSCCAPDLTDGFVAWTGLSSYGGADREVFLFTGTPPNDALQPAPPLLLTATPGTNQVTLSWDRVIGASFYNIYVANDPSVTKDNYLSLPGGQRFTGLSSPLVLTGFTNRIYFFAITAVAGPGEGPSSPPAVVAFWAGSTGAAKTNYYAIAAGLTNGSIAYASGGTTVYQTTNGGSTWAALAGGIQGLDVRALAVDGPRVFAATRDIFSVGPAQILRSLNSGASWTVIVPDGGQIGEQNKIIVLDPVTPSRLYAADFHLPSMVEPQDSFIIRSSDGGNNWLHLPDPTTPLGAEIRAYTLVINPQNTSIIYAGGTGTPNLVRSTDGGTNWTDINPGPGYVYALAIDPLNPQTLYAGAVDSSQVSRGILKSTNSGLSWVSSNLGFPSPPPRINSLLIDPLNPQQIHAGTAAGYYVSFDGGQHWTAQNFGLTTPAAQAISALTLTASRQLLAATGDSLYRLDLSMLNLTLPPTLTIVRSGGTANLSWPASADSGFILESATSLRPPVTWSAVTNPIVITNGQRRVTIGATNPASFFRLHKL